MCQALYYTTLLNTILYAQSSQVAHWLKNPPTSAGLDPWIREIPWRWKWHPTPVFLPGNPTDRGAWGLEPVGSQCVRHDRDGERAHRVPVCPFYCVSLCCTLQTLHLLQIEGSGNTGLRKSIFSVVFAQFASLGPILVILAIFQSFSLLLYLLWGLVIRDLRCYCCDRSGAPQTTAISKSKHRFKCLFWLLHWSPFPHLSPSPWASLFLKTQWVEIRLIKRPTVASKCSSERKSPASCTLNQNRETVKLGEESTSKGKTGPKAGLWHQAVSQVVNAKEKFLRDVKSATPVNTGMMWGRGQKTATQPYCWCGASFSGLGGKSKLPPRSRSKTWSRARSWVFIPGRLTGDEATEGKFEGGRSQLFRRSAQGNEWKCLH